MSTEVDLIRLWRLDCEGRGLAELVIKHYENYLPVSTDEMHVPCSGRPRSIFSSFLLERSSRWAPGHQDVCPSSIPLVLQIRTRSGSDRRGPGGRAETHQGSNGTGTLGGPLKSSGIKMVLRRLSKRSGVVFSSHDARRAFAVAWLAMGGSETGLMAVCGWSSTSMIARYVRERETTLAVEEARKVVRGA